MTDDMVQVTDLRIARPQFDVRDITFTIPRGTVVGLVGPNGAGKTTIIRALLGLLPASSGRIAVLGEAPGSSAALSRIGVVLDLPTGAADWRVRSLGRRLAPFYSQWDHDAFATLLSTHITADLEGLADDLFVLVGGRIAHRGPLPDAKEEFAMARGSGAAPEGVLGAEQTGGRWSALIRTSDSAGFGPEVVIDEATIDDIIIHLSAHEEAAA